MSYDAWKTRSPDDDMPGDLSEPPEVYVDCPDCGGEGGFEKHCRVYEHGCGFAHDDGYWVECGSCGGHGGFIDDAAGCPL